MISADTPEQKLSGNPNQPKRVEQRNNHDCMICCLAMLMDKPYEAVKAWFPHEPGEEVTYNGQTYPYGVTPYEACMKLVELGYPAAWLTHYNAADDGVVVPGDCSVSEFRARVSRLKTKCIVVVESRIGRHAMLWDRYGLVNPAPGATEYADIDQLTPLGLLVAGAI